MVLISYFIYKLAKKVGITQCLKRKYTYLKNHLSTNNQNETLLNAEGGTEGSLPDRLIHPEEYEPLLNNAQEHTNCEPCHTARRAPPTIDPRTLQVGVSARLML